MRMYFILEFGQAKPMIAEKDIICWMLVTRRDTEEEDTYVDLKTSRNLPMGTRVKQEGKFHVTRQGVVTNGFHTFKDTGEKHYRNNRPTRSDRFLIKCIIPRGAAYFHNRETMDYMSSEIVFGV